MKKVKSKKKSKFKSKKKGKLALMLGAGGVLVLVVAFLAMHSPITRRPVKPIKSVNPNEVCMVNDTVMDKPQIPVPFEGKTYYGCCEGCVERIQKEQSIRFSKDPFTGHEVDKAKAFIISGSKGEALYFESSKTAEKYIRSKGTKGNKQKK